MKKAQIVELLQNEALQNFLAAVINKRENEKLLNALEHLPISQATDAEIDALSDQIEDSEGYIEDTIGSDVVLGWKWIVQGHNEQVDHQDADKLDHI